MDNGWSYLQSLTSAISGLGGVGLGAWLTGRRDEKRERNRITTESSYLAVLVVAHLDRFADGCLSVVYDIGERDGRPAGEDGITRETTVSTPSFDPLTLNVDWKVLPRDLMYAILSLPSKQEQLANRLSAMGDDWLDQDEYFWVRQHGYAELGLDVANVARLLRVHSGLPIESPVPGECSLGEKLRRKRDEIVVERDAYYDRISESQTV